MEIREPKILLKSGKTLVGKKIPYYGALESIVQQCTQSFDRSQGTAGRSEYIFLSNMKIFPFFQTW